MSGKQATRNFAWELDPCKSLTRIGISDRSEAIWPANKQPALIPDYHRRSHRGLSGLRLSVINPCCARLNTGLICPERDRQYEPSEYRLRFRNAMVDCAIAEDCGEKFTFRDYGWFVGFNWVARFLFGSIWGMMGTRRHRLPVCYRCCSRNVLPICW